MKHEDESSFLYDAHVLVRVCSILEFKICFFYFLPSRVRSCTWASCKYIPHPLRQFFTCTPTRTLMDAHRRTHDRSKEHVHGYSQIWSSSVSMGTSCMYVVCLNRYVCMYIHWGVHERWRPDVHNSIDCTVYSDYKTFLTLKYIR